MKKKLFIALCLFIVVLSMLSACGQAPPQQEEPHPPVTVQVLTSGASGANYITWFALSQFLKEKNSWLTVVPQETSHQAFPP